MPIHERKATERLQQQQKRADDPPRREGQDIINVYSAFYHHVYKSVRSKLVSVLDYYRCQPMTLRRGRSRPERKRGSRCRTSCFRSCQTDPS